MQPLSVLVPSLMYGQHVHHIVRKREKAEGTDGKNGRTGFTGKLEGSEEAEAGNDKRKRGGKNKKETRVRASKEESVKEQSKWGYCSLTLIVLPSSLLHNTGNR